jgi:lipopolysaccharide/colanic/teichoic acid biosynthesis glycosyltransferase
MVARNRRVISGMATGSPPGRSTYKSPYDLVKYLLDLGFSTVLLMLASPIILLCLIAVRLGSKGSPLYSQKRLGARGRIITIYKIRTMYKDCELNFGPVWSGPGDPRVTPVGRILRAIHLDELPQLLNVLRGEMSLIGPRPERPEIVAQLERCFPAYRDRLLVRPGLTGLAQVLQGPDTGLHSVQRKLELDLFYRRHFGCWLDLRIGLATALYLLHLPRRGIGRVFHFPVDDLAGDEALLEGESIAVSSRVRPNYVN